jgi:hypothetical protein
MAPTTITADQAVFTSIRTPTGEGYRVVAASPGVRAEEKIELTRRSPSQGSLCDTGSGAVGLLTYALDSGRRCVAYCTHAGREHTGRGGMRVYTHMVLLDTADYERAGADPVAVHAAIANHVTVNGPLLKPPPQLGPLSLEIAPPEHAANNPWDDEPRTIWSVADAALAGDRVAAVVPNGTANLLRWALLAIPRRTRARVDAAVGLKFSPSRRVALTLLTADDSQLPRLVAGQGVAVWPAGATLPPPTAPRASWFALAERWYAAGRLRHLIELTTRHCPEAAPELLPRIADLCAAEERIDTADEDTLAAIEAGLRPGTDIPALRTLQERMRARIAERRAELEQQATAEADLTAG